MEDPTWTVIHNYFSQGGGAESANPLVQHQIESYNEFIDKKLSQIIQGFNPIQICHNYKESVKDFSYKIYMTITNPSLSKPVMQSQDGSQQLMTPHLARMNGLTYGVNLYTDIHIMTETINDDNITERNEVKVPNVMIGKIPIMVRSKACVLNIMPGIAENEGKNECRYDPGGYFIVNGNEKVVISQDRISENKTLVFTASGCLTDGLTAEIRSVPDGIFLPPKTTSLHLSSKPNHLGRIIRINSAFLRNEVPLFIVFRALGITSDKEILQHILLDIDQPKHQRMLSELAATMEDSSEVHTQEEAIQYLMKYIGITGTPKEYLEQPEVAKRIVMQIIQNDFLPHVGSSFRRKALYLGSMVRKLLRIYLGYQAPDNRDSCLHKRIDTPGILLSNLFRQCYGKMMKEMRTAIQRELQLWRATPNIPTNLISSANIHRFFKQSIIDMGIRYALSTGNWGVKSLGSFQNIRTGVAQVLNRMSYLSTLSHLRRINTPMEKNGKLVQPRKLENTQFGVICLAETPEGSAVGLVKNMALSTKITISMNGQYIRELVVQLGTQVYDDMVSNQPQFLKEMGSEKSVMVQINGDIVGYHQHPSYFYEAMKSMKRRGLIPVTTCVAWDIPQNVIIISTEAGRMCRPFYVVDKTVDGRCLRFHRLLEDDPAFWKEMKDKPFTEYLAFLDKNEEGFIEYMDVEEMDKAMIAMTQQDLQKTQRNTWLPPNYTHCEIHASLMMGVLACNIPFSDHNQSPRNCYQCLWEEEPVRMADGSVKKIKDVCVGDMVLTFDPATQKTRPTRVINQYVRPTEKKMVEVKTTYGHTILTTEDHKYWTNQGWVCPKDFTADTRVGILIPPRVIPSSSPTFVSSSSFVKSLQEANIPQTTITQKTQACMRKNLLPLMASNKHLPDISRLLGNIARSGTLSFYHNLPYLRVAFHTEEELLVFRRMVQKVGFPDTGVLSKTLRIPLSGVPLHEYELIYEDTDILPYFCVALQDGCCWVVREEYYQATIQEDTAFLPVSVSPTETRMIADITVESDTHCFFGGGSNGCFAVHNSAMGKQAVGIYMSNYNQRIDTIAHVLNYAQKPLARTKLANYTNSDAMPSGVNAVIAIMTKTGFNQEDSVMVNGSALDRGLFASTYYKAYRDQCSKNHSTGEEEQFTKPTATTSHLKPYNYDKLDKSGFVPPNTYIDETDVLIGKVMPHKVHGQIFPRDMSMVMKANDYGYVDMNYQGVNAEGYKFVKTRIRKYRKPTIGDKVSSRHGQKGTIGMIYAQEDMPFSKDGITPDIIVNPHAVPSRMTVGQLIECIMGKASSMLGAQGDATPFNGCSVENIAEILDSYGMERYGNEILYNGRTGEMIHTEIFIGPTFYQRLKHMTADKQHCLTMEHEVLTNSGWKLFHDIDDNDKVAVLKDGYKLVYEKPIALHYYPDYSGKMYHIKNQAIDMDVTYEHRMWVSKYNQKLKSWDDYTLEKASNIVGKYRRYKKDASWESPDYQLILPELYTHRLHYDEWNVPMDSWLKLFGIWIAEGYVYKDCNGYYRIEIAANKERVKEALINVEKEMNITFTKTRQSTQKVDDTSLHRYCLTHQQIGKYLYNYSVGSTNKYLPSWVWELSSTQCLTLINGMMLGDGTWTPSGTQVYHTSSSNLADDFQRLCLHAGLCANKKLHIHAGTVSLIRNKEVKTTKDSYRITVVKKYSKPSVNHGHVKRQNYQEEIVYDYQGPVFCLSVSSEVFLVRRNGKAVWTGNSRGSNGPVVKHRHSGCRKIPASLRYSRRHIQIAGTTC